MTKEAIFGVNDKHFISGFQMGMGIAYTMDRALTSVEIERIYDLHRTTAQSWINHDIESYEHRNKKILIEFLRRYNPKNTLEYMDKYNLPSNNSKAFISESFLIDMDSLEKMESSKVKWKGKILRNMLKINKDLFGKQLEFIKDVLEAERKLMEEED